MRLLNWAYAIGVAVAASAPVAASAQDLSLCTCVTPYQGANAQVGKVMSYRGDVKVTQPAGYTGPESDDGLSIGSRVLVGPKSNAEITVGSQCALSITENSTVNITRIGDNVCVNAQQVGLTTGAIGDDKGLGFPEYFFGAAVGTSAIAGALSNGQNGDDGEPASR